MFLGPIISSENVIHIQNMAKNQPLQMFTIRLDKQTINIIKSMPRNHRSTWLRRLITAAVQDDTA